MVGTEPPGTRWKRSLPLLWLVPILTGIITGVTNLPAAEPAASQEVGKPETYGLPRFDVKAYVVEGDKSLTTNLPPAIFSKHTGTNLNMAEIASAASELQSECRSRGYPTVCVAIAAHRITNGIVPFAVFRAPVSQILVSGKRYSVDTRLSSPALAGTNATTAANTNAGPRFHVRAYTVAGDTLLSQAILTDLFKKYTGTNIGVSDIIKAASELQMEYRDRGFPTVSVTVPQQQITNNMVRIQVFEGTVMLRRGSGEAQTIVENCGNTLILRCSASEHGGTSEFASKLIGQREVVHTTVSTTRAEPSTSNGTPLGSS